MNKQKKYLQIHSVHLKNPLQVTSTNEFFYLKKKLCFVLDIYHVYLFRQSEVYSYNNKGFAVDI